MRLATRILVLVPTDIESRVVRETLGSVEHLAIEQCGFGPIVSAARTAFLIERYKPSQVLLMGIAGSLSMNLVIGLAYEFNSLACYGIGAGQGTGFSTSGELGWKQWPVDPAIGDWLDLDRHGARRQLLTVCSASANQQDVEQRLQKFPDAQAEDMEGFSVAAACRLAAVPLRVIRGISNQAGDRKHQNWRISDALQSAVVLAEQIVLP